MTRKRALGILKQGGLEDEDVDDEAAVLKAFKKLALKWHPDRNIDNQAFGVRNKKILRPLRVTASCVCRKLLMKKCF